MRRRDFLMGAAAAGAAALTCSPSNGAADSPRPNILWLSCEDIGTHLGCYGDPYAKTPILDALAARGVRYAQAHTAAPVCAPNRSSIITGMYASTLGTMHMRSSGEGSDRSDKPLLHPSVQCLPELLRGAGYYCTNNVKTDYNFEAGRDLWDESSQTAHWKNRTDPAQPFFAVFNATSTHESRSRLPDDAHEKRMAALPIAKRQDHDAITPPPYHPNTEAVRKTWAVYHENISAMDHWAGNLLDELETEAVADNTIVIMWSDHGAGLPRCKRWLYDSGTHVPLIVYIPERLRRDAQAAPGAVVNDLICSLDLAPTTLNLAGVPIPKNMQGQPFLGPECPKPRQYVYGFRDRMDERYDSFRSVRDQQFRYVRNYMPWKPYAQFLEYAAQSPVQQELDRLKTAGELPGGCDWMAHDFKPVEELYDTAADPHELNNLAYDPEFSETLSRLRAVHLKWRTDSRDIALIPEPELQRLERLPRGRIDIWDHKSAADPAFFSRLEDTASLAGALHDSKIGAQRQAEIRALLTKRLSDPEAAIRYWATLGLANTLNNATASLLENGLNDSSPEVAVAAAAILLKAGRDARASLDAQAPLDILKKAAQSNEEWIRLAAITGLDEAGEAARPAIPTLLEALNDTQNKYVVRVATHALRALGETAGGAG